MGYIILAPDGIYEGKEWWKYLLSPLADLLLLLSLKTWLLPLLGVKLILPYKDLILKERYVMCCVIIPSDNSCRTVLIGIS